MSRRFLRKLELIVLVLAATLLGSNANLRRRDLTGLYRGEHAHHHPHDHSAGAHDHSVGAKNHSAGAHDHSAGLHGHSDSETAVVPTPSRAYTLPDRDGPEPGLQPQVFPPNCLCVVEKTGCLGREEYTKQFRDVTTLVCGQAFDVCCFEDPWPGVVDRWADVAPCVPQEVCSRWYGQQATDVAEFGVLGPCPGLGAVRCVPQRTPVIPVVPPPVPSRNPPPPPPPVVLAPEPVRYELAPPPAPVVLAPAPPPVVLAPEPVAYELAPPPAPVVLAPPPPLVLIAPPPPPAVLAPQAVGYELAPPPVPAPPPVTHELPPATYEPPRVVDTYEPPRVVDTYEPPRVVDTYEPPGKSYGVPDGLSQVVPSSLGTAPGLPYPQTTTSLGNNNFINQNYYNRNPYAGQRNYYNRYPYGNAYNNRYQYAQQRGLGSGYNQASRYGNGYGYGSRYGGLQG